MKRLRFFYFILSMICVLFIILYAILLLLTVTAFILGASYPHFELSLNGLTLFSTVSQNATLKEVQTASIFIMPILCSAYICSLVFGYRFFKALSVDESPFQIKFSTGLKKIALTDLIAGFFIPIIYSLVLSFLKRPGYFFIVQLSPLFFIGLILYVFSLFLQVGISKQANNNTNYP